MPALRVERIAILGPVLAVLAGCATADLAGSHACPLPSEQRMVVAELFFGRNVRGREPVSDEEWSRFAAEVVTPNFPAGFTVFDGDGQWRNAATGTIARERTKIVLVATPRTPDLAARLSAVIEPYKARFRQQSVGVITRDACADFD